MIIYLIFITTQGQIMRKNTALMNPNLDAFMAVAKFKSVHAAARTIHISQTALTQRLQKLEEKLGITLFLRTRRGMNLTSEGEKLLRYCLVMNDFSNDILADIIHAGTKTPQRVQISGPSSIMNTRIIPRCLKIMRQYPTLYINFDIDDTDNLIMALRTGISQFAIIAPNKIKSDMMTSPLNAEKYLLVAGSCWKGRKLSEIITNEHIIDFDESDHTTINYLKHFKLYHLAQRERLFINRSELLVEMLINGFGYGVLTKEFAKKYINRTELIELNSGKTYDNSLLLAWYHRPDPPNYFSAIIKAIH